MVVGRYTQNRRISKKEQQNISDDKLGENHIYYLPYLMGERAPHNDTNARSCFIGLSI